MTNIMIGIAIIVIVIVIVIVIMYKASHEKQVNLSKIIPIVRTTSPAQSHHSEQNGVSITMKSSTGNPEEVVVRAYNTGTMSVPTNPLANMVPLVPLVPMMRIRSQPL